MIRHGLALHIADKDLVGVNLPKWWGFAYREFDIRYTTLYPIPLNLIVRYTLKLYWLIYSWVRTSGWKDKLDNVYWMGYNDGTVRRDCDLDRLARIILGKE